MLKNVGIWRNTKIYLAIVVIFQTFSACTTLEQAESSAPLTREWTVRFPIIKPLPQTEELQKKGDITIVVAPKPPRFEEDQRCRYQKLQFPILSPPGISNETHEYFEEERYMVEVLEGGGVQNAVEFLMTITNQMDRVFRGSGAVVQFAVDGQIQGIERSHYEGFSNIIIPPGRQTQIPIFGPTLGNFSFQEGKITALFLYDVVISIDKSGDVKKLQNFEWFFSVELAQRTETVTGIRNRIWVTHQLANRITNSQARGEYRCFDL